MSKTKIKKTLSWTAVIIWMALIFYLSAQPAQESAELSRGVTEIILETVERVAPNVDVDVSSIHLLIRKSAHFFAYLVLGVLVVNALTVSNITGYRRAGIALVICILYAISDEVHQLFVPGRSGEVMDVIIDSAGASVGIGMYLAFQKAITHFKITTFLKAK